MLLEDHRQILLYRLNAIKNDEIIRQSASEMEPEEFASSVVLGTVTEAKHDPPAWLFELALDIQENYDEFVQLVAAVFYSHHNFN